MFHHVVLMKFSERADPAFHAEVESFCERLRHGTPKPQRYVYHRNLASRSDGLTHGIVTVFESAADHDRYQVSPTHQAMKAFMTPYIERIVVCDIDEDLPDPASEDL